MDLGGEQFAPQIIARLVQLGTWLPFEQVPAAAASLLRLTVSAETVRRLTEQAGTALLAVDDAELQRLEQGEQLPAEAGPAVQQLSVDGAMVPLVGGQWGEAKTLVIGRVEAGRQRDGSTPPHTVALSYFSRLAPAEAFARAATVEIHRRGTDTAAKVCGPADGAVWAQGFLDLHRPDAVRILDFPHGVEHLDTAANATFGASSPAGTAWLQDVRRELRDGQPAEALAWLCRLPVADAADPVAASAARDAEINYFANRWHQIQYASFRAAGLPIGSGAVESANKLVVEARLKGSGMHWAPANVNPLLALRNAWCSGRWDERWQQSQQQRRTARAARRRERRPAQALPARPAHGSAVAETSPTAGKFPPTAGTPAPRLATGNNARVAAAPRRPAPTHPWRRYGRSLTPRPRAKL